MPYVDGFVIAVPKDKLDAYKAMAREFAPIWKEHGATDYVECVGDDTPYGEVTSFPRAVQLKEDEVVIFSWIVYESREARDAINKKAIEDPRLKKFMEKENVPFDGKVEIRPMMYLALSYDHRLVDGRDAVTFLVRVKENLEDPERLLLEV